MAAEYRSAAIASEMLHWSLVLGLPPALARRIHALIPEELEHAELSRRVHQAAGGTVTDAQIPQEDLSSRFAPSQPLQRRALFSAFQEFAVHESIALSVFQAMQQQNLQPVVRRAIDTIVRDEAGHRRLGWQIVEAMLERTGERSWLAGLTNAAIHGVASAYDVQGPRPTPEDARWGLLDPAVQAAAIQRALQGGIARNVTRMRLAPEG